VGYEGDERAETPGYRVARLKQPAAVEDIDFHTHRGLDKSLILSLAEGTS